MITGYAGIGSSHGRTGSFRRRATILAGATSEILDEAAFRAGRAGVAATLPDDDGCLRPVAQLLESTVARVWPAARELRCERELDALADLLQDGGGAGVQRRTFDGGGFPALLETLATGAYDMAEATRCAAA